MNNRQLPCSLTGDVWQDPEMQMQEKLILLQVWKKEKTEK